jgi:uncharacterized protein (DUF58 family)
MNAYESIRTVTRLSTFAVFLLAMAVLGLLYHSTILLSLFEAGVAYLILSYLYVALAAKRVEVRRELPSRAYEEDVVTVTLTVRYSGFLPLHLTEVQDWSPIEPVPGKSVVIPELRAGGTQISYTAKCDRGRGRFTMGPIKVILSDPLGFFRVTRPIAELSELIVYPRTFAIRDLGIRGMQSAALTNTSSPLRVGQTPLFYGTREYQSGDNPRWIHWRASARWGRLILKEFETPSNLEITCFLDLNRATLCGLGRGSNIEQGISIAASLAEYAELKGYPFQLVAEGEEATVLPPRLGRRSLIAALDALARSRMGRTPYVELLRRGRSFVGEESAVLLIFNRLDFDREGIEEILAGWMRKRVHVLAVVMDESTFIPIDQMHGLRDPNRRTEASEFLNSLGVTTIPVQSGVNLEEVFQR